MFKRKKILIMAVVLVLMLAMTVTAYATFSNCYLHPDNTGEVKTAALSATASHCSGYNSLDSTNNMYLRLQVKKGTWERIWWDYLDEGEYNASPVAHNLYLIEFRTKICSYPATGGVEGVGCCFDY